MEKYLDSEQVFISLLSGYNTYTDTGDTAATITGETQKVIRHNRTRELYFAVPISTPKNLIKNTWFIDKWRRLIEHPCNSCFIWPVDFIRKEVTLPESYLVYEFKPRHNYKSLAALSKEGGFLGVENPELRSFALSFAGAYESVCDRDYLLFGIDDDSLFVDLDNYSLLIQMNEDMTIGRKSEITFTEDTYFSEVLDPFRYERRQRNKSGAEVYSYDMISESYAFVSILFRLLIGLYPYEGPGMDEYEYHISSSDNKDWIYRYVQNPVFIFDENDKSNSIDMYKKNEINTERWSRLGPELRRMFTETLVHDNVMRTGRVAYYSAAQWKAALENSFAALS